MGTRNFVGVRMVRLGRGKARGWKLAARGRGESPQDLDEDGPKTKGPAFAGLFAGSLRYLETNIILRLTPSICQEKNQRGGPGGTCHPLHVSFQVTPVVSSSSGPVCLGTRHY